MARFQNQGHHQDHQDQGHQQAHHPVMTPPDTPPTSDPTPTPEPAALFSDIGTTFNDATRAMVGGLWQNVVEEAGQG
ncbi:MAG: hypothetical protein JWL62_1560, partial [Hyphomicrobiales bacterium]|nr:hypothetical protein [Hyphomicrobiales bacterium]